MNGVAVWPRLVVGQGSLPIAFPPAAIRVRRGDRLSDAELLVPDGRPVDEIDPRPAITWLIEASGSHEHELYLGIQSLMMQSGGDHDALAIVGSPDPATLSMAQQRFAGGVADFSHVEAAIASIDTPLTGFMGHGNHPSRSARGRGAVALARSWIGRDSVVRADPWRKGGSDLARRSGRG